MGIANPKESSSEIDTTAANNNSEVAAKADLVLNPAVNDDSEERNAQKYILKMLIKLKK